LDEAGFDWIVFDVGDDAREFGIVADPVVVGFRLPEGLAGTAQDSVCFAGGCSLERLEEVAGRDLGKQQGVDVIRHDDECGQIEVAEFNSCVKGGDDELGDGWVAEVEGPGCGTIEVAVDPHKCAAGRGFFRGWEAAVGETSVEVPGEE